MRILFLGLDLDWTMSSITVRFGSNLLAFVARMLFGCDLSHFVATNIFRNNRSITTSFFIISIIWCASPNRSIFCTILDAISMTVQMQSTMNRITTIMYWYICKYVKTYIKKEENKNTKFLLEPVIWIWLFPKMEWWNVRRDNWISNLVQCHDFLFILSFTCTLNS